MFTFCCGINTIPKDQAQDKRSHLNPIYHKLGGKKRNHKNNKAEQKTGQTYPTKKSIIYDCALSNFEQTSRQVRASSELVQSVCIRGNKQNEKYHIKTEKAQADISDSMERSADKQLKYSQLQDKYISVLERANVYLQKALQSKEKNEETSRNKSKTERKGNMRTQLQELKNRLNNIDLAGINKLAKLRTKTQSRDFSSVEEKQNRHCSAFKELRCKIL